MRITVAWALAVSIVSMLITEATGCRGCWLHLCMLCLSPPACMYTCANHACSRAVWDIRTVHAKIRGG